MVTTPPKRHGCLTALLIYMLIINSLTVAVALFAGFAIAFPEAPSWLPIVVAVVCTLNIFLTFALFRWQRWAFYVFCGCAGAMFIIYLAAGLSLIDSAIGLLGPAVLYGVLQIGKENKGWLQLK